MLSESSVKVSEDDNTKTHNSAPITPEALKPTVIYSTSSLHSPQPSILQRRPSISRGTSPIKELFLTAQVHPPTTLHNLPSAHLPQTTNQPYSKQVKGSYSLESSSSVSSWMSSNSSWSSFSPTKLNVPEQPVRTRPNSLDVSKTCIVTDL